MKLAVFTTLNQNHGDDFIREGLLSFFGEGHDIKYIDKHNLKTFTDQDGDKIEWADKIILAGTPFFWCLPFAGSHSFNQPWIKSLWHDRIFKNPKPVFNLGGGSCQTYNSTGEEYCQRCCEFITQTMQRCCSVIVRDKLAQKLLKRLGFEVESLPCPSMFLPEAFDIDGSPELLLFNFMPLGNHWTLTPQGFSKEKWHNQIKKLFQHLNGRHKDYLVICHDRSEEKFVEMMGATNNQTFYSPNYKDYPKMYAKGRLGIFNRLHAAFAAASFGQPVIGIGGDTRTRMLDEIGQPRYLVNAVPDLVLLLEQIDERFDELQKVLQKRKEFAREGYSRAVKKIEEGE